MKSQEARAAALEERGVPTFNSVQEEGTWGTGPAGAYPDFDADSPVAQFSPRNFVEPSNLNDGSDIYSTVIIRTNEDANEDNGAGKSGHARNHIIL